MLVTDHFGGYLLKKGENCTICYCGRAVRRAAETALVYSEYITAYIQGLYNTVRELGGGRCVRQDGSDPK
jgi:hypothetical protein